MRLIYVGVDQTGAVRLVRGERRPVPLCSAFLTRDPEDGVFELQLKALETLSLKAVQTAGREVTHGLVPAEELRYQILLDCVFGLAEECFPTPEGAQEFATDLLRLADEAGEYGRPAAEAFFARLRPGGPTAPLPIREVERLTRANSVFLTRPFQKNVQTGTYRLWKDLGHSLRTEREWFRLWPFHALGADPGRGGRHKTQSPRPFAWIAEAYPSLVWRTALGSPRRNPAALSRELEKQRAYGKLRISSADLALIARSHDWADATVLALFSAHAPGLPRTVMLTPRAWSRLQKEGWIFGCPFPGEGLCG